MITVAVDLFPVFVAVSLLPIRCVHHTKAAKFCPSVRDCQPWLHVHTHTVVVTDWLTRTPLLHAHVLLVALAEVLEDVVDGNACILRSAPRAVNRAVHRRCRYFKKRKYGLNVI